MYSIILEKVLLSSKLTYQSFAVDQMSIDEVRLIFKSSSNLKINEICFFAQVTVKIVVHALVPKHLKSY